MKSFRLIAAATLIFVALAANSQRYFRPRLDIGFKAGATMANQQFSPSIEQKMLQGFIGGVTVRYSEEKLFGLLAELNIDQRGWKEDFEETPFTYSRTLTYIDLPIMTHINFGGRKFRGFVNLGPSVGYMIGDKISANFDYENPTKVDGFPLTDRHVSQMSMAIKNKFDYGIVGGAGMEFRIKGKHFLMLEGRYYFGLGNIFPSAKKDEFSASRGTSIQIALSYMFRLK